MMRVDAQKRMAWGAALATLAGVCIVLSLLLGWSAAPRPWGFLLGFATGVVAGLGATLAISGLIEYGRGRQTGGGS
jgi:hypothetical protein